MRRRALLAGSANNIIKYTASAKLTESRAVDQGGIYLGAFSGNVVSHTFSNGVGTIVFDADITSIGDNAFKSCTILTSITLPNSVTSIGYNAFRGCSNLTSANIPNGVTSIKNATFYNCYGLTSITIPNSVISIDSSAFNYCSSLTSITIGNGVTSIGDYAFYACPLESIICNCTIAPTVSNHVFQSVKTGGTLRVPAGSENNYSTWMSTANYYLGKYNWTIVGF